MFPSLILLNLLHSSECKANPPNPPLRPEVFKLRSFPEQARKEVLKDVFAHRVQATEKQIEFALSLLASRGFGDDLTSERFEEFGFPFQVGANVEGWLAGLTIRQIAFLIDDLKSRPMEFRF